MPPKTEIALPPLHISQGDIRCDQLCNGDRVRERRFRPRLPPPLHDVQFMGDAYRARPATLGDLSAVQLCGKFGTVTRLSAPSSFSIFCFLTGCTPDYLEAGQTVYCTAHAIPVPLEVGTVATTLV
jgi:hypothetical protein